MSLRKKTLLIAGVTLVALTAGLYVAAAVLLPRGFARIEQTEVRENVQRAMAAVSANLDSLNSKAGDWAPWDDCYRFIEDANAEFIKSNLSESMFTELRLNAAIFVHRTGRIVWSKGFDLEKGQLTPPPPSLLKELSPGSPLLKFTNPRDSLAGIVLLPEGPLMLAARPIVTSEWQGPIRGTLILGRFIDPSKIQNLAAQTHLKLEVLRMDQAVAREDLDAAKPLMATKGYGGETIRPIDETTIAGYGILPDVQNRPALLMKVQLPRRVHLQGIATLQYLTVAIVLAGILGGALTLLLLERQVLGRITSLSCQIMSIRASRDPAKRVRICGKDELGLLADEVNATLDGFMRSQDSLRHSEASARQIAAQYHNTIDSLCHAMHVVNRDMRILVCNAAMRNWCAGMGHAEDPLGQNLYQAIPSLSQQAREDYARIFALGVPSVVEEQFTMKDKTLTVETRKIPVLGENGVEQIITIMQDISERKLAEEQLRHAAQHDRLTDLPNRAWFHASLSQAISRHKRYPEYKFAVMFLDFDHFKVINDSLGHQTGDELLVAIGQRLRCCLRDNDVLSHGTTSEIARLGGDEFVILLDAINQTADAVRVAERIQNLLDAPFHLHGHEIHIRVSIGIVSSEGNYEYPDEMLRDADIAMYRAKTGGRSQHVVFDRQMHDQAMARLQMETDLRKAVERNEFHVVYQPIVSTDDQRLCGFESLLRWNHPQRGLVSPVDFIPVAEETGLITPIGWWMLDSVARQLQAWQQSLDRRTPLSVNINLSKRQLTEPGFVQRIAKLIQMHGLAPSSVTLEVTESAIMEHPEAVAPVLAELKQVGVLLAMDDFGTGQSSLSLLHRFPIDVLKIDRAFISDMQLSDENKAIVHAIVMLAHTLKMQVVAEGVETAEQLEQLRQLGCDHIQGYHIARPLSAEKAGEFIENHCRFIKSA